MENVYKQVLLYAYYFLHTEALFEFTQNTYIGLENVASPPGIPFAIRLASASGVLGQLVTVTVTSGAGSAIGRSLIPLMQLL